MHTNSNLQSIVIEILLWFYEFAKTTDFCWMNEQMNSSRKQASVPIPAPILSRVRELADMQTQVQPSLSSSRLAAHND